MKARILSTLLATLALLAAGCGLLDRRPVLHVYNWSDYMDPDVIPLFEQRFNCRVVLDTFDSNEAMYAKLKAGATGYDVVFPSSYQAAMMWAEGMLLPLNHANLPNLRHVDRAFLDRFAIDSEMRYAVPFMSGTTGIAYRQSAVGADAAASWALFDRSDLRGRVTLLNDMREAIGAALKFLGHSLNSTDPAAIEAAADVVIRWKGNIAKFENEGYKPGLASGEFHLVHGYSGDIMQVIEDAGDDDIVYVLPREGFAIWADDMAIPASADNIPLAEAFINFLHDPEIAALNMAFNYYVSPNVAAYELVDAEMRADPTVFIDAEAQAKAEQIKPLGEHQALYIRAWDRIKSAR